MKNKKQTVPAVKPANLCPTKAPAVNLRGDYASPGKLTFGRPLPVVHPAALAPFKMPSYLLGVERDAKTIKGTAGGYLTGILYLAPGQLAGVGNLCPHASAGCLAACLFTAGHARFENVNRGRVMRTRFLHDNRVGFLAMLRGEIAALVRKAKARGLRPVVRLNGTSDLPWETLAPELFTDFPTVRFYDYAKSLRRVLAYAKGEMPRNYHLTFSLSETNAAAAGIALAAGVNVAAVADGVTIGKRFALPGMTEPRPTFSADRHDLRFLDRKAADGRGRIGILKAKGKARGDQSGFVIRATAAAAA